MDQPAENQSRAVQIAVRHGAIVGIELGVVLGVILFLVAGILAAVAGLVVGLAVGGFVAWRALSTDRATQLVLTLSRAEPADPATYARLHNVVEGLCAPSGLTKPAVHVIADTAPNALAVGRSPKDAAIAVTTGLLDLLDRVELEAVVARELSLIKSAMIAPATVVITTVGWPTLFADRRIRATRWNGGRAGHPEDPASSGPEPAGFEVALASANAKRIERALGPELDHAADLAAAGMTRYPPALASAMDRIGATSTVVASGLRCTAHLWLAAPIATTPAEGELAELNQRFVHHHAMVERVDLLREL